MELRRGRALVTRRAVLRAAAAAGAATLLPSCSEASPAAHVTGRIVGVAEARGHVLREPLEPSAATPDGSADVVVLGAGIAWLSAAWKL